MEEKTTQKHSIFGYGAIGFTIVFACITIVEKVIAVHYKFWKDIGFELLAKNYVWKYIELPENSFDLETKINHIIFWALTLILIYIMGWMFSRHKSVAVIEKAVVRIPLINTVFRWMKKMFELVHQLKTRPFVMLKDYPEPGFETIGVAVKKQIFQTGDELYAKPCVLILTSFFLPNGVNQFPEQEKVFRIKTPSMKVFTFLVMFGFTKIDKDEDKDRLEIEGLEEESRKDFIKEYYTV